MDETSIKVQGKKYWIWVFTTPTETSVVIRKSRGMKVLLEIEEAAPLDKAVRRLYRKLNVVLEADPPPEMRRILWYMAQAALRRRIRREYDSEMVEKFIGKIENGFEHWFMFVLCSDVELTNNRAERALREQVVQRKII